jgi:hypothetical protein
VVADECLKAQGFLLLAEKLSLLRHGRNGLFRKLVLQKTGVADESRVKGRNGDIKARIPIEKSKPEDIGPEKSPERTEGSFRRQPTGSFL